MFINIGSLLKKVDASEKLHDEAWCFISDLTHPACWIYFQMLCSYRADSYGTSPGTSFQQDMFEQKQFAEVHTLKLLPRQTLSHLS